MHLLFLIISAIALMFGNSSHYLENFYCETFYTEHTWESAQHNTHCIKSIEIDVNNTDISIEAVDYDEGVVQICGRNFEENFKVNKVDNTLYITSKDDNCNNCKFSIYLPVFYQNNIKFNINSKNGNMTFSGNVNVNEIFCNIINGDVLGDSLIANKIDIKTDKNHTKSFSELISKN